MTPKQGLVQNNPEREEIRRAVDRFTLALLGRHVEKLPLEQPGLRFAVVELAFGDTEVDNLYLARPRDEQVGG